MKRREGRRRTGRSPRAWGWLFKGKGVEVRVESPSAREQMSLLRREHGGRWEGRGLDS